MKLYVAATRQNDGKTMVSLGLLKAFKKRRMKIAYMKPVGQQYNVIDGKKIDKDVILMHDIFHFNSSHIMQNVRVTHRRSIQLQIAVAFSFTKIYFTFIN